MKPASPAPYRLEHWHDDPSITCNLDTAHTLDELMTVVVRHAVVLRQQHATGLLVGLLAQPGSAYEVLRYSLGPPSTR